MKTHRDSSANHYGRLGPAFPKRVLNPPNGVHEVLLISSGWRTTKASSLNGIPDVRPAPDDQLARLGTHHLQHRG